MKIRRRNVEFKEKGITLIALVITIIVLLILAAVSIATLTGENGLLTRASDAKKETEEAKEDELRRLTALEAATNLEDTTYIDNSTGKEKTVTIPAGFAVSQVEGENTIEDGLVIIDSKGNEFVWVPVSKENFETEFLRKAGYCEESLQPMTGYGEANAEGINVEIDGITKTGVTESSITVQEVKEMYDSVYKNEGFYIGRYEAGKDKDNAEKVVVQKGVDVYNNVKWSKNGKMNEETETTNPIDGAIELARNFDTENNYTTVTSTLCYGVQWDKTLSWIDPEYDDFAKNSTEQGNYNEDENTNSWKGNVALTGASEDYKINNIYDLAGNVIEWTMESNSIDCRANRGGSFGTTGVSYPASSRNNSFPSDAVAGFRVTLYLDS